jgi:hypothetical protein
VALLLAAININSITAFMRQARPDTTGILRRPRKRRRTTRSIATWHPRVITRGGDPPT